MCKNPKDCEPGKLIGSPRFVRRSSKSTIFVLEFGYFTAKRVSIEPEGLLLSLMLDIAIINSSSYHTSCRLVVRAINSRMKKKIT